MKTLSTARRVRMTCCPTLNLLTIVTISKSSACIWNDRASGRIRYKANRTLRLTHWCRLAHQRGDKRPPEYWRRSFFHTLITRSLTSFPSDGNYPSSVVSSARSEDTARDCNCSNFVKHQLHTYPRVAVVVRNPTHTMYAISILDFRCDL